MAFAFDQKERLGSGYFGEVWLATDVGLQVDRALKIIPEHKIFNPENFFQEAQLLKASAHPNVVDVYETGTTEDGSVYVAMEYLPKGSLEDEAKGRYVPMTRAKRIMVDVLRALEHTHEKGLLHRDIKPGNILIGHNSEGKLSDFGLALPVGINPKSLGLKGYMYALHCAPEVKVGKPYSIASEIYSCGVTLYRLVNGDTYLISGDPPTIDVDSFREFVPTQMRTIIRKCLDPNPDERYPDAVSLRRAVENLAINMNWNESKVADGTKWTCGHNDRVYVVSRTRNENGRWDVDVLVGPSKQKLRRRNKLCESDIAKSQAYSKTRRILQRFVTGQEK